MAPISEHIRKKLSGRELRRIDDEALTPAAVLVPVFERGGETRILFTQRAVGLTKHGGEVSFPGGRVDPEDSTPVAAALRETEEEIGVPSQSVSVLGELDEITTVTHYRVQPVVGIIPPPERLKVSEGEIAIVFDVSIDALLDPGHYKLHRDWEWKGRPYAVHQFIVNGHNIWGATGKILAQFLNVVYGWGDAETVFAGRS